jgi:hypothetical protein
MKNGWWSLAMAAAVQLICLFGHESATCHPNSCKLPDVQRWEQIAHFRFNQHVVKRIPTVVAPLRYSRGPSNSRGKEDTYGCGTSALLKGTKQLQEWRESAQ